MIWVSIAASSRSTSRGQGGVHRGPGEPVGQGRQGVPADPQDHFEGVLLGVAVRLEVPQGRVVHRARRGEHRQGEPPYGFQAFVRKRGSGTVAQGGDDLLARSAEGFDRLRAEWARTLGEERLTALERDLCTMAPGGAFRLDAAGWFTG